MLSVAAPLPKFGWILPMLRVLCTGPILNLFANNISNIVWRTIDRHTRFSVPLGAVFFLHVVFDWNLRFCPQTCYNCVVAVKLLFQLHLCVLKEIKYKDVLPICKYVRTYELECNDTSLWETFGCSSQLPKELMLQLLQLIPFVIGQTLISSLKVIIIIVIAKPMVIELMKSN